MQFDPILRGLQRVTRAPIRYFTQVVHLGITPEGTDFAESLLFCLGEHGFFIVNKEMTTVQGEVVYAHIDKVSEQKDKKRDPNVIQLELSPNRSPAMPARVTFVTSSKEVFLKHLRCYWQTDYMWRLNKVASLKIFQEIISTKRRVQQTTEKLVIPPPRGYDQVPFMGYFFFLPHTINVHKLQDEWEGKIKSPPDFDQTVDVKLRIEVEDLISVENMKSDLRNKCEAIANVIADGKPFWYLKNVQYIKKCNFSGDIASWKAWILNIRTSASLEIAVVVMRRKFIPPLMDTGQDIILTLVSETAEADLTDCLMKIADSFHTFPDTNEPHKEVVERKVQSLLLDEEGYRFYSLHLGYTLSHYEDMIQLIYSLAKILSRYGEETSASLMKKLEDSNPALTVLENVNTLVEQLEGEVKESQPLIKRSWSLKLARYIAYCVDGGMFYGQFTLSSLVVPIVGGHIRDKSDVGILRRFIAYLLHIKKLDEDYEYRDLAEKIKETIVENGNSYFNEKVMIVLIEEDYIQRELEISGDTDIMERLLGSFLQNQDSSIDLKCATCRYVISAYANRSDNISLKSLLPQVMECMKSTSAKLATLASTAIVNMTRSNEQIKRELLTEENFLETLKSQLSTPNQALLINLLRAFNNMASNSTYRKFIGERLLDYFVHIIKGTGIVGTKYDDDVVAPTIGLLTLLARDVESKEKLLFEHKLLDLLVELMTRGEDVQTRVLVFMQKLASRGVDVKRQIAAVMMQKLIEILGKADEIRTADYAKQVLTLLLILTTAHEGNIEMFKRENGPVLFENLRQSKWVSDPSIRSLIDKIIASTS